MTGNKHDVRGSAIQIAPDANSWGEKISTRDATTYIFFQKDSKENNPEQNNIKTYVGAYSNYFSQTLYAFRPHLEISFLLPNDKICIS